MSLLRAAITLETVADLVLFFKVPYPIYTSVLLSAKEHEEVQKRIGENIKRDGWKMQFPQVKLAGTPKEVQFSFWIKGSKGKAKVLNFFQLAVIVDSGECYCNTTWNMELSLTGN